jgi:hypothetical protein
MLNIEALDTANPKNSIITLSPWNNQQNVPYLYLSYCWGPPEDQQLQLQSNNLDSIRNNGIPWAALLPSQREAILFVKRLGYC